MKNWKHTAVICSLLLPLALLLHPAAAQAEGQCIPISYIGNAGPQIATAFSHDGSMLLMSSNNFVTLHDIESGELLQSYINPNLPAFISGVFYDDEKKHVLASHMDGTISAWDAVSGALLNPDTAFTLTREDSFYNMKWHAYSLNRWEIGDEDTLLKTWRPFNFNYLPRRNTNINGWFMISTYDRNAPGSPLTSHDPFVASSLGFLLDASGIDNNVIVLRAGRMKVLQLPDTELVTLGTEIDTAIGGLGSVAWSPDGNTIVSISTTDAYLLDAQSGSILKKVPHDGGLPDIVDWTEGVLFAAYIDGRINVFNEETLTVESTINVEGGDLLNAHASPSGRKISATTVLSRNFEDAVSISHFVYELDSNKRYTMMNKMPEAGSAPISLRSSHAVYLSAQFSDEDKDVVCAFVGNGLPKKMYPDPDYGVPRNIAISPDGKDVAVSFYSSLKKFDVASGTLALNKEVSYWQVSGMEYTADSKYLRVYEYPSHLFLDAATFKVVSSLPLGNAYLDGGAMRKASPHDFPFCKDGEMYFFNIPTGVKRRASPTGITVGCGTMAGASDLIMQLDENDVCHIKNFITGETIQSIPIELGSSIYFGYEDIDTKAISDDGSMVAIATNSQSGIYSYPVGRIRIYDVATGAIIQEQPLSSYKIAFIENDRFLHFRTWGGGFAKLAVRPTPCDGGEGESTLDAADILARFHSVDYDRNGLAGRGPVMVEFGISPDTFAALDTSGDLLLSIKELTAQIEGPLPIHSADADADGAIAIGELLRVIQLYNSGGYTCAPDPNDTEDGYQPAAKGALDPTCRPHASDYQDNNGAISLSELLRLIQLYTIGTLAPCPEAEDGFCAAV